MRRASGGKATLVQKRPRSSWRWHSSHLASVSPSERLLRIQRGSTSLQAAHDSGTEGSDWARRSSICSDSLQVGREGGLYWGPLKRDCGPGEHSSQGAHLEGRWLPSFLLARITRYWQMLPVCSFIHRMSSGTSGSHSSKLGHRQEAWPQGLCPSPHAYTPPPTALPVPGFSTTPPNQLPLPRGDHCSWFRPKFGSELLSHPSILYRMVKDTALSSGRV